MVFFRDVSEKVAVSIDGDELENKKTNLKKAFEICCPQICPL